MYIIGNYVCYICDCHNYKHYVCNYRHFSQSLIIYYYSNIHMHIYYTNHLVNSQMMQDVKHYLKNEVIKNNKFYLSLVAV